MMLEGIFEKSIGNWKLLRLLDCLLEPRPDQELYKQVFQNKADDSKAINSAPCT